jgi:hypothetical protein
MTHTPSIDYSCSRCGASQTYRIVPGDPQEQEGHAAEVSREIPSIDLSCSRCSAGQTYRLVPDSVATTTKH